MHLSENKIKTLLSIGFSIDDEFTSHVIEFEKFNANEITICLKYRHVMTMGLLIAIDFDEEVLNRIYERLELYWLSFSHLAERYYACSKHWKNPNSLKTNIQKAIVLIFPVLKPKFSSNLST